MAHQQLPSYQEATARRDWLGLVAPYASLADHRALCLVSARFWNAFAPRLWRDPLWSARQLGLDPGDDIAWWGNFVFNKLARVRPAVRSLVRVLDLRDFAKVTYHFSSDHHAATLHKTIEEALILLPNVMSILLDGHEDIEPLLLLQRQPSSANHQPLVLSLSNCPLQLPNAFFSAPKLQSAVYLDLSGLRGSIWPLVRSSPLPELRVLKVRGREIDDSTLIALVNNYRLRLWSLDMSDNKITDGAVESLISMCFPAQTLRTDTHFEVEGRLLTFNKGSAEYGTFGYIQESPSSRDFSHTERYFADTPDYTPDSHYEPQEHLPSRLDGCQSILQDSANAATKILSDLNNEFAIGRFRTSQGITHIQLSRNQLTSFGLLRLLRGSNGQLEHVACDSMPLLTLPSGLSHVWPRTAKLNGIVGGAHAIRPVFSSNLRVLRIHHSLVTHIPTLEMEGLSKLSRIFLSENSIHPRVEQAYRHPYVPDANPRLYSLTLTCIPRRSSGPLTRALIRFLEQLSVQERAIQEAKMMAPSRRGPRLLQGLRHLRLEFDSDEIDDDFSSSIHLDAGKLMSSGDTGFSFFQERIDPQSSAEGTSPDVKMANASKDEGGGCFSEMNRDNDEFVTYHGQWNGETFSVPVWIGRPAPQHCSVINDYRSLVTDQGLRLGVGPAGPDQVAAGAPKDSYIFHTAWCAAIMPKRLVPPNHSEVAAMYDVLLELKKYRAAGRAKYMALMAQNSSQPIPLGPPHYFWTGHLEVSTEYTTPKA